MRLTKWNPTASNDVATRNWTNRDPFFGLMNEWFAPDITGRDVDVDIYEEDDHFVLTAEMPGVKKEDLHVNVEDDVLTISAEKRSEVEENKKNAYHSERRYGKFTRSFRLNGQVDTEKVDASYENGVLKLVMPKREEVKSRPIDVKVK